ncbi:MAG: cofactor-independent phosphoglycerate mutase [Armatimonadetes bacterium]|nr:cofactor-independent phosphoglycerate mutase [Armatimonadota bacterium]
MKYLLIVFDGMADEPLAELDLKTPMQVARKPYMDDIARRGVVGAVRTTPEGMQPGSDITNMSILGYDPARYYTGRAPIEAASLQIPMEQSDVAFRANLVATDGAVITDSSAGHISSEEARELIDLIDGKLSTRKIKFYPGVSYRHIMVWRDGSDDVQVTAPYKIHNKPFEDYLPVGDGEEKLRQLIYDSLELLDSHPINRRRRDEGKQPANMLWLWGQGRQPSLVSFLGLHGLTGSVVAAVDLIRGLGRLVGLKVLDVPGATGYVDTNYLGKGQYALEALRDRDFVWVHVEAADEAAHEGKLDLKIEAIESMDKLVLGTILNGLGRAGEDFRLLLLPDHPTPVATQSHTDTPVPFVLYSSTRDRANRAPYDERAVEETSLHVDEGYRLIDLLFEE